jgi:hypothetical protein
MKKFPKLEKLGILGYELRTKNPFFYYTPERRWASDTSETGGESWDPVLKTCRFFQDTGIARECTFPIISWINFP